MTKVVTWQSAGGMKIDIAPNCEARMRAEGEWPRDAVGREYATVSHGLHATSRGCECASCASEVRS
jgi:hypothetical protein